MVLIVVPSKRVDLPFCVVHGCKPVDVQTFFPEPAVERFDGGIVRWLATTAEVEENTVRVRPHIHRGADELTAVVPAE